MRKILYLAIMSFTLMSCSSSYKIKDPATFDESPLVKASIMPTEAQLSGKKTRVVVFALDDNSVKLARHSNIGDLIGNKVEDVLSRAGVEIVDRKLAKKLQKELVLAEVKGKRQYKGPELADYSFTGKVVSVAYGETFTEAKSWIDKKGKERHTPASCGYNVRLEATLQIHSLPSLDLVDTITIADSETQTQPVKNNGRRYYSSKKCPTYSETQIGGIVSIASTDAVNNSVTDLKNIFAPRGYVTEYRKDEDKNIYKITIG